MYKQYNCKIH